MYLDPLKRSLISVIPSSRFISKPQRLFAEVIKLLTESFNAGGTLAKGDLCKLFSTPEESLMRTAEDFGVEALRIKGKTGVWVNGEKLASIGIHLKKWVTYHGLALNVTNDLSLFNAIVPCGLTRVRMTSLQKITGNSIDIQEVKNKYINHFPDVWNEVFKEITVA